MARLNTVSRTQSDCRRDDRHSLLQKRDIPIFAEITADR
jgi:hypothetical protein